MPPGTVSAVKLQERSLFGGISLPSTTTGGCPGGSANGQFRSVGVGSVVGGVLVIAAKRRVSCRDAPEGLQAESSGWRSPSRMIAVSLKSTLPVRLNYGSPQAQLKLIA